MMRFVRVLTFIAVAALAGGSLLRAQTDYANSKSTSFLTIGPSVSGGASLIFQPPDGSKLVPFIAWRGAADATYPLSPSIGAAFGLGLEGRSFRLRSPSNTDVFTNTHLTYLTLTPGFRFSAFFVGMNIGLPMSGSYHTQTGTVTSDRAMTDTEFDEVSVLAEPKLGAVVEIMNNESGWLALTIMGTVSIGEVYDRGEIPAAAADAAGDFHVTSAQLGLTYQFAIPGTKR